MKETKIARFPGWRFLWRGLIAIAILGTLAWAWVLLENSRGKRVFEQTQREAAGRAVGWDGTHEKGVVVVKQDGTVDLHPGRLGVEDERGSRGIVGYQKAEYESGQADAFRDLERGLVHYKILGMIKVPTTQLQQLAKERYGITIEFLGCLSGPRVDYDREYQDAVIKYLEEKYSFDPVRKIQEELKSTP